MMKIFGKTILPKNSLKSLFNVQKGFPCFFSTKNPISDFESQERLTFNKHDNNESFQSILSNLTPRDKDYLKKSSSSNPKESSESYDDPMLLYNRNFKVLVLDCFYSVKFLNSTFKKDELKQLCSIFVGNIIKTKNIEDNEKTIIRLYDDYIKQISFKTKINTKTLPEKILNSLMLVYEFLDRGMRGFLTGDINLNTIICLEELLEAKIAELKEEEKDFVELGLNLNDFYESMFKIDYDFFKLNYSGNITLNLNKQLEKEGKFSKKLMYYVNLKHIHFSGKLKEKLEKIAKNSLSPNNIDEVTIDKVNKILKEKKDAIQEVFNSIYNEAVEKCITNKLKTPSEGISFPKNENPGNLFRRQLLIEENSFSSASDDFVKIYSSLKNIEKAHELFFNRKLVLFWHNNLNFAISEAQRTIISEQQFLKKDYLRYIIALKSEEVSIVCLLYLIKELIEILSVTKDPENIESEIMNALGEIESETDLEVSIPLVSASEKLGSLLCQELRNTKIKDSTHNSQSRLFQSFLSNQMFDIQVHKKTKVQIGLFLIHLMIKSITFLAEEELYTSRKVLSILQKPIDDIRVQNFLYVDQEFVHNYYADLQKTFSTFMQISKALPMIYSPMPWKNFSIGSYYLRNTNFSKIFGEHQEAVKMYHKSDLSIVMKILDSQGSVPWRINNKVLQVVDYIWTEGGNKASIPPRFNDRIITKEMLSKAENFKKKLSLLKESQHNRELHSLRCDFQIKLQIARDFSKIKEFYFPHNIDYRGRTYPLSPQLNHIGNDFCRGLLEYSEGKALGKTGLKWLKIHLANVMGRDKLSLEGRIEFADSIVDTIHEVAKDPFNNLDWVDVDDPWQCLATMFEISSALKVSLYLIIYQSNDHTKYVTHLHCHVDGSCNGLQHYSALGRDFAGGYEVNLVNRDRPGDVYTKVLHIVLDKVSLYL